MSEKKPSVSSWAKGEWYPERTYQEGVLHGLRLALSSYKRLKKHPQALDYETLLRVAIKRRKEKR